MSRSFPWDSMVTGIGSDGFPTYDRDYDAQDLRDMFKSYFRNGVVANEGAELNTYHDPDGSDMSVTVDTGIAHIEGSTFINDRPTTLDIQPSESKPRIDTVVLRFDKTLAVRDDYLDIVKGTASDNPVRPQLTREDTIYELGLGDIYVEANATSIGDANITSTVEDSGRCGYSGGDVTADNFKGVLPVSKGGTGVTSDAEIGLKAYPVGALYLSFQSTSPAQLFGGSWTQISGYFLRAASDTNTGGADTVTLTTAQMPWHKHGVTHRLTSTSGGNIGFYGNQGTTATDDTTATGNSQSFSVMPSYQNIYVWRRTA